MPPNLLRHSLKEKKSLAGKAEPFRIVLRQSRKDQRALVSLTHPLPQVVLTALLSTLND